VAHLIGLVPVVAAVGSIAEHHKMERSFKAVALMGLCTAAAAATLAGPAATLFGVGAVVVVITTPEPLQAAHRRLVAMAARVDRLVAARQEHSPLVAVVVRAQAHLLVQALPVKSSSQFSQLDRGLT
jgi:hypothetical protein